MSRQAVLYQGEAEAVLAGLPDESVHCCVTSPPYWGLRDYGVEGQLGLEATPELYVERMVAIFREVRRVLRDDATLWLNLGDTYATGAGATNTVDPKSAGRTRAAGRHTSRHYGDGRDALGPLTQPNRQPLAGFKPKDLVGIPWMVAFALRADGWYLRSDIVWAKPNPMPESVTDRPTKAHEYLFLLSKSPRYYFDAEAIKEPVAPDSVERNGRFRSLGKVPDRADAGGFCGTPGATRNIRSVWTIATAPFPEAHFATFPPALVEPCIKAGTSEKGCCPECGAPWERISGEPVPLPGPGSGNKARRLADGSRSRLATHLGSGVPWQPSHRPTAGWLPTCDHGESDEKRALDAPRVDPDDHVVRAFPTDRLGGAVPVAGGSPRLEVTAATVLDPFAGSGTTGMVAARLGRAFVGIDLNAEYVAMAERRIREDAPLWNTVSVVSPPFVSGEDAGEQEGAGG